jgi:hypothetical protein
LCSPPLSERSSASCQPHFAKIGFQLTIGLRPASDQSEFGASGLLRGDLWKNVFYVTPGSSGGGNMLIFEAPMSACFEEAAGWAASNAAVSSRGDTNNAKGRTS